MTWQDTKRIYCKLELCNGFQTAKLFAGLILKQFLNLIYRYYLIKSGLKYQDFCNAPNQQKKTKISLQPIVLLKYKRKLAGFMNCTFSWSKMQCSGTESIGSVTFWVFLILIRNYCISGSFCQQAKIQRNLDFYVL